MDSFDVPGDVTGSAESFAALRTLMVLLTPVNSFDMTGEGTGFAERFITVRTLVIKISPFFVMNVFHMDDQILFFRKYFTTV